MTETLQRLNEWVNAADGPLLFAAQEHQEHELAAGPHQHVRGQLFGSLSGLLSVGLGDGLWIVPAIHAVWLPPHQVHSGRSHGPFHGWSVYVAESACADLPQRACTLRTSGLLREAVLRACSWPLETPARALAPAQAHLAAVILEEIRSLPVEPLGLPLPSDPRLQRIARALIDEPADDRRLEQWAAWGAVSARTLSRRFVAETGFNFTAWRQRARMLRALEMLAADMPVSAIALDLGYSTASAFISLFRRTFGDTPASYRLRL
ncbi:helix-turn-helix domain-containing protein [Azoarcus indigens]|uniref:AraC family transcriptional regulator n=1 Tax=Azoarcus indigens TaxID=29545 RepID=A0A4R6E0V8_9RHOO|nr:helix-turn-helix transcriptional regulator [Azoarcus indigens]NMG66205.1 helix-turn-helix domain-containing protein [Azoarcus indigens]TDN51330.1 AraC family transcriptional regulator [Azoarcus indigens]